MTATTTSTLLMCFCELPARQSAGRSLGSDILMGDLGFHGHMVTTANHQWPQQIASYRLTNLCSITLQITVVVKYCNFHYC